MLLVYCIASCTTKDKIALPAIKQNLSPAGVIEKNIDSLKSIAEEGDLILRLGDDFISDRIKFLSENDPSYSHAGIIILMGNEKKVCNIYPDEKGADTVKFEPLDSFINPKKNLVCGLYRYDFSKNEKNAFLNQLVLYHKNKVHFDKKYLLTTDDKVYCTEMICKSLKRATNSRISCKLSYIPKKLLRPVSIYFSEYKLSKKQIEERQIIAIDNLYNMPGCKLLMKFSLKKFPGQ